ncbi:ABC transporter permease [Bordetella trematum]|uniref:ABC transporter permease n=1 Tax=Bordetella trematum TaxID=123899 RepID=UPI0015C55F88|nr:FtsX-like permease family protein [Bordetella trematum]
MMDFPDGRSGWRAAWRLGWSMARRDARAGELRLLALSLVVAVAAVTSVGFLADRVWRALERDAAQMLGADVVLQADAPIPEAQLAQAAQRGLQVTQTLQFPSMAMAGDAAQLVSVKAVSPGYPLRGSLRVAPAPFEPDALTRDVPAPGMVWADPQLLTLLGLSAGDTLQLGDASLKVDRVLTYEPDRGMQFVNVAPRLMLNRADLPATGLVTEGSRIGYAMLAAGDPEAVAGFESWLGEHLQRGQQLATLESGRPEMRRMLDRAQRFLGLVALLAVLISAVAVALAAGRFMARHRDGVAVMRCLGASQRLVTRMLWVEFLLLGLAASLVGCLVGLGVHQALVSALAGLIDTQLPAVSWQPAAQGLLTGLCMLLGFALPSLARLRQVPPARVLRREEGGLPGRSLGAYALGAVGLALLIWWVAGDTRLALAAAGSFAVALGVFAAVAALCVQALARVRRSLAGTPALRFALAGVVRRRAATITQVCALAVGLMALLLLALTRSDLVEGWRHAVPADAPNRFLINIQPEQREPVLARLQAAGLQTASAGESPLWPMVRGRLVEINGKPANPDDYSQDRAKRLLDREFNLSYAEQAPAGNRLLSGRWLDPAAHEVSLESGLATTLGLKEGDVLTFDVAGEAVPVTVAGTRRVDWDTMRVNFFAILSPAALADKPQSWITAFHLPPERAAVLRDLVREFPNLTVFDVGAILAQLQTVLEEVVAAVQLLFLFTVGAGVLVLATALSSTRDERLREAAILRALGATRAQLARAQRLELMAIGALAGLLAAAGAWAVAWLLSTQVFEFALTPSLWPWLAGLAGGMGAAGLAGMLALRGVLRAPPLVTLRDA